MLLLPLLFACTPSSDPEARSADPSCLQQWVDGVTEVAPGLATDPSGPKALFDGETIWVAWSHPDAEGDDDVWMQALSCDGTPRRDAVEVNAGQPEGFDPVLALSEDRLLVAWTSHIPHADSPNDIRLRAFDLAGEPLTLPVALETTRGGEPFDHDRHQPDVAPREGGFWLTGSWDVDGDWSFQTFVVPLDLDGVPLEEGLDTKPDLSVDQWNPRIEAHGEEVRVAWEAQPVETFDQVPMGGPMGGVEALASDGWGVEVAHGPSGWWMAWNGGWQGPMVRPAAGPERTLDIDGSMAALAATGDGAVVLSIRPGDSVNQLLTVWRLDAAGAVVHRHPLHAENADWRSAEGLVVIDDTHVVVFYTDADEGRLMAEWITFP